MEGNGCEGQGLKYDFIKKCWENVFFNLGYFKSLMMLETILNENWTKSKDFYLFEICISYYVH